MGPDHVNGQVRTRQLRTLALPPDPAASRETLTVGVCVGVFVGVVAHPARSPTVSTPKMRVAVVRDESFNMLPRLDGWTRVWWFLFDSDRIRGSVGAKVCADLRDRLGESDLELFPAIVREAYYRDAMDPNGIVTLITHQEFDVAAARTIGDIWFVSERVRSLNIG